MTISIYTRQTIDRLPWPDTPNGDYARRLLGPLVCQGPRHLIANVDAEVQALLINNTVLPVVLGNTAPKVKNAYVCSPTTHYIDYAIREVEIELHNQRLARSVFPLALNMLRPLLHWSAFERVVFVNNWLLSTNLYPEVAEDLLPAVRDALVRAFPDRTIIFRSVNDQLNARLKEQLGRLDFRPVFSRQVYILDPSDPSYKRKKSFQKDVSLARRTAYHWQDATQIRPEDIPRIKQLYDDLYLEKYSFYNPQFTEQFMSEALREQWLHFWILKRDERIDGVLGFVKRDGVMTAPLIGYDRSVDPGEGLYRLISLKLVEEAVRHGLILNQSSGASTFKQHRGSIPVMEYNMVYDHHLAPRYRLPWQLLDLLSRNVIAPMMRHYGL